MTSSRKKLTGDSAYMQLQSWLPGMTAVSQRVGQSEFDKTLFSFLNEFLAIDHFAVFTYSTVEGAGHLFTKSIMPAAEAEKLAKDYVDQYHQRDLHFRKGSSEGMPMKSPFIHDLMKSMTPNTEIIFLRNTAWLIKFRSSGRLTMGISIVISIVSVNPGNSLAKKNKHLTVFYL
jgi:hypothetical protein